MNKSQKKPALYDRNSIEAIRDVGTGVVKSVTNDLGRDAVSDLWDQILGSGQKDRGEMNEGQEINLAQLSKKAKFEAQKAELDPAINWKAEILSVEKNSEREFSREVSVKIQEIVIELKRIASSSKELQTQFKQITTEQKISKPGKYHLTFFEFMLAMVKTARLKIENSGAWLATTKSKKAQKGYWNQFKKHGTSFGLSNERVVATQTG